MKITSIICSLLLIICSCNKPHSTLTINGVKFDVEGTMEKGIAKCYYKNGTLKAYAEVSDSMLNGKYVEYYDNGKIKREYNHKNGQVDGPSRMYYKTGKLFEKGLFKDGYSVGTTIRYSFDGSKIAEIESQNNEMVSLTEYHKGNPVKYRFNIKVHDNSMVSRSTYYFSVSPEPKMVKYYVKSEGRALLLNGDSYTLFKEPGQKFDFVVKGVSQYGIPFKLTARK